MGLKWANGHAQGRGATTQKLKTKSGYSRVAWSNVLGLFVFDLNILITTVGYRLNKTASC
jgi:hypothetical protein